MRMEQTGDLIVLHDAGRGRLTGGVFALLAGLGIAIVPWVTGMAQSWLAVAIGGVFAVLGAISVLSASSRTATVARDGRASVTSRRLIGGAEQTDEVEAGSVRGVRLETGVERDRSGDDSKAGSVVSRLYLVLEHSDTIELAVKRAGSASVGGFNLSSLRRAPLSAEAQAVADLLGVELEAVDTSSLKAVFGQIKSMVQEHTRDYQEGQ